MRDFRSDIVTQLIVEGWHLMQVNLGRRGSNAGQVVGRAQSTVSWRIL